MGPSGWSEHLRFETLVIQYMLKHLITISYYTLCLMFRHLIVNKYHLRDIVCNQCKRFYPLPSALRKLRQDNEYLAEKVRMSFS